MNAFGKSPQERAMGTFIHDTNKHTWAIEREIKNLMKHPDLTDSGQKDLVIKYLEFFQVRINSLKKAMDKYYDCFSNNFQ